MTKTIKIKQVATVDEKDWVKVYNDIKEYRAIAEELGSEELDKLNGYLEEFRAYAMQVLETNNYVTFAEIDGEPDKVALVELDYAYTGNDLLVTRFFSEGEDAYVEVE